MNEYVPNSRFTSVYFIIMINGGGGVFIGASKIVKLPVMIAHASRLLFPNRELNFRKRISDWLNPLSYKSSTFSPPHLFLLSLSPNTPPHLPPLIMIYALEKFIQLLKVTILSAIKFPLAALYSAITFPWKFINFLDLQIWDTVLFIGNLVTPLRSKGHVVKAGKPGHGGVWPPFVPPTKDDSRAPCPYLSKSSQRLDEYETTSWSLLPCSSLRPAPAHVFLTNNTQSKTPWPITEFYRITGRTSHWKWSEMRWPIASTFPPPSWKTPLTVWRDCMAGITYLWGAAFNVIASIEFPNSAFSLPLSCRFWFRDRRLLLVVLITHISDLAAHNVVEHDASLVRKLMVDSI